MTAKRRRMCPSRTNTEWLFGVSLEITDEQDSRFWLSCESSYFEMNDPYQSILIAALVRTLLW